MDIDHVEFQCDEGDVFYYHDKLIMDGMYINVRNSKKTMIPLIDVAPALLDNDIHREIESSLIHIFEKAGIHHGELIGFCIGYTNDTKNNASYITQVFVSIPK